MQPTDEQKPSDATPKPENVPNATEGPADTVIEVRSNGSLLVKGRVLLKFPDGREELREKNFSLCRCGASKNKPFCDGSHKTIGFAG